MKLAVISFTEAGIALSRKIAGGAKAGTALYTKCSRCREKATDFSNDGSSDDIRVTFVKESIGEWSKQQMIQGNALLFIGACGIAVRAIAPYITDKLHDSPVLVMDESGQYVIPILSGHVGGANDLAMKLSDYCHATPVITTATDLEKKFAVDVFAKKNRLRIMNKDGIAKVSSKLLAGEALSVSMESGHPDKNCHVPEGIRLIDYPPSEPADIVISENVYEGNATLVLCPQIYCIGMGCKKGKSLQELYAFVEESLQRLDIGKEQLLVLSSIDRKRDEEGLKQLCRKLDIPFMVFTADELLTQNGDFTVSAFVESQVGVNNVCERAALAACGTSGQLIYKKHAKSGMTIAIARKDWSVRWDEE